MHLDPSITVLVAAILGILAIAAASKLLNQPNVVGYLAAGIVLGPAGLGLITDTELLDRMGAFGVLLLMFFVGMEVTPRKLLATWKIALLGTLFQIGVSIGFITLLSPLTDWSIQQCVFYGFVISLSSTAVVIKLLETRGMLQKALGQDILSILLAQDLAIIPMMMALSAMNGGEISSTDLALQGIGSLLLLGLLAFVLIKKEIHLPFARHISSDHELQVFAALGLCFGLAVITSLFNLSGALGAFVAGIVVSAARETDWVRGSLESMRALFLAFFFVSIGMLIDPQFLYEHLLQVSIVVVGAFTMNTAINAFVLRLAGYDWRSAVYGSSYLAQIGEFSFMLAAIGVSSRIINKADYNVIIVAIAVSLMVSPFLTALAGRRLQSIQPHED
ncbi:cation:proton antiporter [Emcibacter sp. SYSU 3D8]|uniref:cation:proton antiporter n=1 Tax=Emcibacter sp. SYSU 3D8 TaxID=3133969 RepID=UPI0031FF08B5